MSARDDLLSYLEPAIRQQILADSERYAPMLALFAAWKEEVEGHAREMETNVIARLAQELFPAGAWRFPG